GGPCRRAHPDRVPPAPLPADERRPGADQGADPRPRLGLRLRRRRQRAGDLHQLPAPQGRPRRADADPHRAGCGLRDARAPRDLTVAPMSLRLRLLITLAPLFILGLVAADVGTYLSLQSFLVSRVDDQLTAGH